MNIIFEYSPIFDQHISELMGTKLDEAAVSWVEGFLPEFSQRWNDAGTTLLDTACSVSGFKFKHSEMKCIVTVSDFVSMSHPFIVNVKKYRGVSNRDFLLEVVFHEALHILLTDNWKVWPTNLLKEHAGGDRDVEAHLHLMSVELATHMRLGNVDRLVEIDHWYEKIGGGYSAAWNIVRGEEKFKDFLGELKDPTQWQSTGAASADALQI